MSEWTEEERVEKNERERDRERARTEVLPLQAADHLFAGARTQTSVHGE